MMELYYSVLLNWFNSENEKQPMTDRFWTNILIRPCEVAVFVLLRHVKNIFWNKEIFCPFPDFKDQKQNTIK